MLIEFFPSNRRHEGVHPIAVRARLRNGSELVGRMQDTILVVKSGLGVFRFPLSHVVRLKNVSNVVTMRRYLWANRIEVLCLDGSCFIGEPRSPSCLRFFENGTLENASRIDVVDIDYLVVEHEPRK